ncbi:hypothetical protein PUN28_015351 [Cardiocondyla obscurior]|uniref:Uncharacterized protein n=1 Tax=Cardiocondyla obscurior TaxID=286306 RepID=A0AAW2EW70_9HYME
MHARGPKVAAAGIRGRNFKGAAAEPVWGLASRKDGQCTVEILCVKSGASGAHLNHVGGTLKAIRTSERPRTAGPSARKISVLDTAERLPLPHCFNDGTLRPVSTGRLVKSPRSRGIQSRTKDPESRTNRIIRYSNLIGGNFPKFTSPARARSEDPKRFGGVQSRELDRAEERRLRLGIVRFAERILNRAMDNDSRRLHSQPGHRRSDRGRSHCERKRERERERARA